MFKKAKNSILKAFRQFRDWWLDKPLLKTSAAFVVGEGFFEAVLITASAITFLTIGNYWMAGLFGIWAAWEIVSRMIVVRHIEGFIQVVSTEV